MSKNRIDYTSVITMSSGTNSLALYNRDKSNQWSSVGSNDGIQETIRIDFKTPQPIDSLLLLNSNLHRFDLIVGGAWGSTVLFTGHNHNSYFYQLSPPFTPEQKICAWAELRCYDTQIPNQEKKVGELMLCEHYYQLAVNPSSITAQYREESKEIKLNDGSLKMWKVSGSERAGFDFDFDKKVDTAMLAALEGIKKTAYKQPFNLYMLPDEQPENVYLVNWLNSFNPQVEQAWNGAGSRVYSLKMELKEV
ncbi:MAG: hypothetical protein WC623_24410 [Pedobacter sp.]|uniref:hypothetical protein n=1 Tax=Pedobacter sp. TaxID=1411316 RepID=UPI0035679885